MRTNNRKVSCICCIFVHPHLHSAPLFFGVRERSINGVIYKGALTKTANDVKCVAIAAKSLDLKALQTLPVICDFVHPFCQFAKRVETRLHMRQYAEACMYEIYQGCSPSTIYGNIRGAWSFWSTPRIATPGKG